jgi:GDPmannose 4,6-dehydratase
LAEFLVARGYEVHGVIRRASTFNTDRIDSMYADPHEAGVKMYLHYGDMTDAGCLRKILESVRPDEIYNLAAQSHVRVSFDQPQYTAEVVGTGTLHLLEAVRDYSSKAGLVKFYQAGSSEMFGATKPPQNESAMFYPRSPYAVSKVAAHWFCVNYREAYGLFVCNGILFNHESHRRGETFVTRKITKALGRIKYGLQDKLFLGNLDSRRDWGYAGDYVEAMWLMLQQSTPDDYVIATGESHSVREFLDLAGSIAGVDWSRHVEIDPRYYRPTEVDFLLGDSSKARRVLGWKPIVGFTKLVEMMVEHDLKRAEQESLLVKAGHKVVGRGVING